MEFSFRAALFLVGFLCACFFVIFPQKIQLRKSKKFLIFDYSTVPIAIVILLFVVTSIPWVVIVRGFLGVQSPDWAIDETNTSYLIPYTVIILFMTLAYVCMSAGYSKLFIYIANKFSKIALSSKNPGVVGLSLFSLLSAIFTLTTSNDIVILTLTPIILQFSKKTDRRLLLSLLIAEFCSANSFSAGLVSGNPSNFILASVFKIDFMTYLKKLLLPATVSGCVVYVFSLIVAYRSGVGKKPVTIGEIELNSVIIHEEQAKTEVNNEEVDKSGVKVKDISVVSVTPVANSDVSMVESHNEVEFDDIPLTKNAMASLIILILLFVLFLLSSAIEKKFPAIQLWHIAVIIFFVTLIKDAITYRANLQTIWTIIKTLPWTVPLFLLAMFILVEAASYFQFTAMIASVFARVVVSHIVKMGDFVVAFVFNALTCIACIIFNNLPATIFLTRILSESSVKDTLGDKFLLATFSVAAGTNFGACIMPHGSLAGLMWSSLVKDSKILKRVWINGSVICLIMIVVCSAVLSWMI